MRAVIMAGGKGTRLHSLTNDEIPKSLVPVCGKPIIQWQIECLQKNGISEICIIVGHLGNKIIKYLGDGSAMGVKLRYFSEEIPLGTAGALGYLKEYVETSEAFMLVYGDIIFDIDVERMASFHKRNNALATLFAHPNSHPYDSDILILDKSGRVNSIIPKNAPREGWCDNMVNAGMYMLSREMCGEIPVGKPLDLEKGYLACKIPQGRVFGYVSTEYVKDAGTPERIKEVTRDIEKGITAARNLRYPQKCVFIDRDGTINNKNGLIYKTDDFKLLPFAAAAIRKLNMSGFLAIVVTNQPVVARGLCGEEKVDEIHRKMKTLLGKEGAYIDALYYCPHHPDKGYPEENPAYKIPCECRKPGTAMIRQALNEFNIDPAKSWMIGDTTTDIQTGINAGLKTVLVLTGEAGRDGKYGAASDAVSADLSEAVDYIIDKAKGKSSYELS